MTRYTRSRKLITVPSMSDISSAGSARSLRSQVSLNDADIPASTSSRKAFTKWTEHDETLLIQFLANHKSEAGDTFSYKQMTFTEAAKYINDLSKHKKGAPKSRDPCKTKWTNLKAAYYAVVDIKKTSGFSWSDETGAGITDDHGDVWDKYVKTHHSAAKSFKNKGFSHFNDMDTFMSTGKGAAKKKFVTRQPKARGESPSLMPPLLVPPPGRAITQ
ncbi:hypothetical protein BDR05DRAFT_1000997 [Suillus weaverae]|nr:hypothetical protein BDR05DRAFT_1000997 [Suillus weaverae]